MTYKQALNELEEDNQIAKVELSVNEMARTAIEKQLPKPPIPDENATGIDGKPVPRCQICGYALDLRMEQYCPCCGQRLTEYEVKKDEA